MRAVVLQATPTTLCGELGARVWPARLAYSVHGYVCK